MDETSAPTTLRAGDSAAWSLSLPAYPATDGWALKYRLLWPAGAAADIATTASGTDYAVSLSAADTAAWTAEAATLVSWVERGVGAELERVTLGQQAITILPDLTAAATFDDRSRNQKALDDARNALETYLASGRAHVAKYDIAGRSMEFRSADEILALIQHYDRECAKERAALAILQGGAPGRIRTRF